MTSIPNPFSTSAYFLASALFLLFSLPACISSETTKPLGSETTLPMEFDLGYGLKIKKSQTWTVAVPFDQEEALTSSNGCRYRSAVVGNQTKPNGFTLILINSACTEREGKPINGATPTYLDIEKVSEPQKVVTSETDLGELTLFTENYSEFTNERTDYQRRVGILELRKPPDPEWPTINVLLSSHQETPDAEVEAAIDLLTHN